MAESPGLPDVPEAVAEPPRRHSLPLVWLLPVIAIAVGGWLAVRAILEHGPTITITFRSAEGLEAGKTKIRFKEVEIGTVTAITLSSDRTGVVVTADIAKSAENLIVEDTRFWVVRPRITGGGVSGIGTLLSGAYIGMDDGDSTTARRSFVGLEAPPVLTAGLPGSEYKLRADNLGSITFGTPVYFRRLEVGEVIAYDLDEDGSGFSVRVFVNAPYDRFVRRNTRFWQASGIDINVDASGLKVDTQSLVTILLGGIAFETPDTTTAKPADENASFHLFADRSLAMNNPDTYAESYVLVFRESVRGLRTGAPVDFRGLEVGEVTAIHLDVDRDGKDVTVPVEIRLYPERMRSLSRNHRNQPLDSARLMANFVERGLRAQLRTANLVSGQLYVALDFVPGAARAKFDPSGQPPELPTAPGSFEELQKTLGSIAAKLDKLPVDKIAADLRTALQSLDHTLKDVDAMVRRIDGEVTPDAREAIADVRRTVEEARATMQQLGAAVAADSPLQLNAGAALREVTRAAQALRTLADTLERHPESLIRGKQKEERQ